MKTDIPKSVLNLRLPNGQTVGEFVNDEKPSVAPLRTSVDVFVELWKDRLKTARHFQNRDLIHKTAAVVEFVKGSVKDNGIF